MTRASIDFSRLLKLRLIVARFGEMDLARWWNTKGQLGRLGAAALRRGFPRTHYFAQARSVFAVAGYRCQELFGRPDCVTLWQLPEAIEEQFNVCWEHWLDDATEWESLFQKLGILENKDLVGALRAFEAVKDHDIEAFSRLRRSSEGRVVPLSSPFSGADDDLALLALGFARGEVGALAVPYSPMGRA